MLKPTRMEVDCVFHCPGCNAETWYTVKELKCRSELDCPCGKTTKIQPVKQIKVIYTGEEEVVARDGKRNGPEKPKLAIDDFVNTLVGFGHKKADARKLVLSAQGQYTGNDGEFITLLLSKG